MSSAPSPRRKRSVTIRDVARRVGVSPMTVSRVINDKGRFSASTRDAVHAAIEELGFARNPAAHSLALARSVRMGVLYDRPGGAYLSELLIGLVDEASRAGHQVMLQRCDGAEDVGPSATKLLRSGIDGVILLPPFGELAHVRDIFALAGKPAVVISGKPGARAHTVRIDDYAAAREVAELLIGKGHRAIGFIEGDTRQSSARDRRQGYVDACTAAGLMPGPFAPGDFSYRSGLDAATVLLESVPRPTAIFASNDDMAAAAMTVAHRQGLDLPRDLSIVGFDDTRIAITTWPELTTVHQPLVEMARVATELLIQVIDQPEQPGNDIVLSHTLIARSSA